MFRIRVTVEPIVSTAYPLFYSRLAILLVGLLCFILSILSAVISPRYWERPLAYPVWVTQSVLLPFSALLSLIDFYLHRKRDEVGLKSPEPSYRDDAAVEPTLITPDGDAQNESSVEEARPEGASETPGNGDGGVSFLPPALSESEKSSSTHEDEDGDENAPLRPHRLLIVLDLFFTCAFASLYITGQILETIHETNAYALKLNAGITGLILAGLHFKCALKATRARKQKGKNTPIGFTSIKPRRGILRI